MTTLLIGDSHTNIFLSQDVNRLDIGEFGLGVFTIHRFVDPDNSIQPLLNSWLRENSKNGSSLVITSGEIDIRAHYWRQLPRYYKEETDIVDQIKSLAFKFYQKLTKVINQYGLKNIVVWGSPTAGERALYNSEYPFSGSSITRNILTHLWNKEFANIIKNDTRVSLCSAYYNFIETKTYATISPNPSHDGVHWHDSFGTDFWNVLISPALSTPGLYVGEKWSSMMQDKFNVVESESQGMDQYDTWVRTDQITDLVGIDAHITIGNISYSWVRAEKRSALPDTYKELILQLIPSIEE
jgi:hypothetical protein